MWSDDYEGNGNAGGNSDGYEGGWEGTSAAYADQRGHDVTWMTAAERGDLDARRELADTKGIVTAALAARQAREEAFEAAMGGAGKLLQRELDHAGAQGFEAWKVACKRAAWERYSSAGQRVGDAYRAAMAAPLDMPAGVEALSLVYREVGYGQSAELFRDMPGYQARLIELAAVQCLTLEYTEIVRTVTS